MNHTALRRRFLWLLKNTLNRVTSRLARTGFGPFSLIRHVGRRSGRTYETPVILAPVPEGFIAELTHGENVNWYRNIVAAVGCLVVQRRRQFRVTSIEPCSREYGLGAYAAPFTLILKVAGRKDFRLLRTGSRRLPSRQGAGPNAPLRRLKLHGARARGRAGTGAKEPSRGARRSARGRRKQQRRHPGHGATAEPGTLGHVSSTMSIPRLRNEAFARGPVSTSRTRRRSGALRACQGAGALRTRSDMRRGATARGPKRQWAPTRRPQPRRSWPGMPAPVTSSSPPRSRNPRLQPPTRRRPRRPSPPSAPSSPCRSAAPPTGRHPNGLACRHTGAQGT